MERLALATASAVLVKVQEAEDSLASFVLAGRSRRPGALSSNLHRLALARSCLCLVPAHQAEGAEPDLDLAVDGHVWMEEASYSATTKCAAGRERR